MIGDARVVVVMPGRDVAPTLERTVRALPPDVADAIVLVDDGSTDETAALGRNLGLRVISHARNRGYGAAQKSGYKEALALGADVAVMVHPDFQYRPELMPALASMVVHGGFDLALGSRVLVGGALAGGMPAWKFAVNRALTWTENRVLGAHLSEYHTGYRAFSRATLERLPLAENGDDFVFDNEVLAQAVHFGLSIGEVSCPARYFDEMQTIGFEVGVRYGLGCLRTMGRFARHRAGISSDPLFDGQGAGLDAWAPELRS